MSVLGLRLVRVWIPVGMIVGGLLMVVISPDLVGYEGAAMLIGGAMGVAISNRLHRMGIGAQADRSGEEDARAFLDRYGVWPDQATAHQLAEARADGFFDRTRGAAPLRDRAADAVPGDGDVEGRRHDPHRRARPEAGRRPRPSHVQAPSRRPGPHDLRR